MNILENCRQHPVRPPGLRLLFLGVRRQPDPALLGEPQRRPPPLAVRGQQEGQRADGPQLFPSVRHPGHRPALLHRLRPLGPPRHGPVHLHPQDPARRSRRGVQLRRHEARFHLHRRHRGGHLARAEQAAAPRPGLGRRPSRPGHFVGPLPRCSTSATTVRSTCCISSVSSRRTWAGRPRRSCCRCSRATCARPAPTSRTCAATWASPPPLPIETGVARFVQWYHGLLWQGIAASATEVMT